MEKTSLTFSSKWLFLYVGGSGEKWSNPQNHSKSAMFRGSAIGNIDIKSRLILPTKFRKYILPESNNSLILTRGKDDCLLIYPMKEWEKVEQKFIGMDEFNEDERFLMRDTLQYVTDVEMDSQYRILIPKELMKFAQLEKEVEMIGMLDKIEIWNPQVREKYNMTKTQTHSEIAQSISDRMKIRSIHE